MELFYLLKNKLNFYHLIKSLKLEWHKHFKKFLGLLFEDYKTAFDTVPKYCHPEHTTKSQCINQNAWFSRCPHGKKCASMRQHRTKAIHYSSKYMFKYIRFGELNINIDGERVNHLRFANDNHQISSSWIAMRESKQLLLTLEVVGKTYQLSESWYISSSEITYMLEKGKYSTDVLPKNCSNLR